RYAMELIQHDGVLNDKPAITPLDPTVSLNNTDGVPLSDTSLYRTLIKAYTFHQPQPYPFQPIVIVIGLLVLSPEDICYLPWQLSHLMDFKETTGGLKVLN
ncbi:hypothetical protein Tco_0889798, partial [Tanacetum coccineum]